MKLPWNFPGRVGAGALLAAAAAGLVLQWVPGVEERVFARFAAQLAGLALGAPARPGPLGWEVAGAGHAVVVTAACSATGFFLLLATLVGGQAGRLGAGAWRAGLAGLAAGFVGAIFVNALRIAALAHVHHWVIPRLPVAYGAFVHLLTGVGVFLPALIVVNLLFEHHGNSRLRS